MPLQSFVNLTEETPFKRTSKRGRINDAVLDSQDLKKKKVKTSRPEEKSGLDLDNGVNLAIGSLDRCLLADYVALKTQQLHSNLSLIELEEKHIPEKSFLDTSEWRGQRTLKDLPAFLERFSFTQAKTKNLSMASKKTGAPHSLVVTSAGLRAADITRVLRTFQTKDAIVAKLFAKHIRLYDALNFVQKTRMNIGVGTPTRLTDLLDAGVLSTEKLERIIVDFSYIDQKKRGILDMKETLRPLIQLLNRSEFKSRYELDAGGIDLIFF